MEEPSTSRVFSATSPNYNYIDGYNFKKWSDVQYQSTVVGGGIGAIGTLVFIGTNSAAISSHQDSLINASYYLQSAESTFTHTKSQTRKGFAASEVTHEKAVIQHLQARQPIHLTTDEKIGVFFGDIALGALAVAGATFYVRFRHHRHKINKFEKLYNASKKKMFEKLADMGVLAFDGDSGANGGPIVEPGGGAEG